MTRLLLALGFCIACSLAGMVLYRYSLPASESKALLRDELLRLND